jgi:hypothetical protein
MMTILNEGYPMARLLAESRLRLNLKRFPKKKDFPTGQRHPNMHPSTANKKKNIPVLLTKGNYEAYHEKDRFSNHIRDFHCGQRGASG